MPVFAYRALTGAGRAQGGVIGAESARAAWQALRSRGVYPTDVRQQAAGGSWTARRPRAAEVAAMTRQLATLVEAGVPLAQAFAVLAEETQHPALVRALVVVESRLGEGTSLADALAATPRVFPPLFRELVRAGEASGALGPVLARLAEHTEASAALRARLRAALAYPAVMAAATVAVLAFLLIWVVPQLSEVFAEAGARLPVATRALLALGALARRTWWVVLGAGLAGGWGLARWTATPGGRARLDAALLAVPLVGPVVLKGAVARFTRTLATLLVGGVPLDAALGIAGPATGNRRLADAVAVARAAVREGEPLASGLRATAAFPALVVQVAAAGERSGTLAGPLERAALAYERDVESAVSALGALVEPVLVLVMGAVVLFLVAAVLLPLFDLGGAVR